MTDAGKAIPMQMFMLWMSGNSVQIFSIMITAMLLFNGVKAISGVNAVFERFQAADGGAAAPSLLVQKLAYILVQCALIGLGLWKCNGMGLLPTSHSDWLSFLPAKTVRHGAQSAPDPQHWLILGRGAWGVSLGSQPLEWSVGPTHS